MTPTAIEWTSETWNPVTGCDRVSAGCDHCYAQTLAKRLKAMGNPRYQNDGRPETSGPGFGVTVHPDKVDAPLRWKKPRTIFVNSMSDLWHADVPGEFIVRCFAVMARTPQHTYQILTKRPGRMRMLLTRDGGFWRAVERVVDAAGGQVPDYYMTQGHLPNVWLGVSVENQATADKRIPVLLDTPASVKFLSCEPLLGPVDLAPWLAMSSCRRCGATIAIGGCPVCGFRVTTSALNWVIVGGESGPGARPMNPEWARSLRDRCVEAGVPFFFKQWGGHTPKANGRELDGRTWDEMPVTQVTP